MQLTARSMQHEDTAIRYGEMVSTEPATMTAPVSRGILCCQCENSRCQRPLRVAALTRSVAARSLLLLWALVAAWLMVVPGTASAADRVRSAIDRAHRTGAITAAEKRQFVREWNASASAIRSLIRSGKVARAAEVAANRAEVLSIAKRGQLAPERVRAVMGGVRATTYVFTKRGFPKRYQRFQLDFDPVTYGYYPGHGVVFQPLFTMARANDLYFAGRNDELVRLVTRLDALKVTRAGGAAWEYYFSFDGGRPPWISGMAQGQAVSVLARTYKRTADTRWVKLGERVIDTFDARPSNGGFTVPESGGRWYLLYSFNPRQRILNGHLQAIIGLTEFQRETTGGVSAKNELANVRANEGSTAALALLPKFDTGAWSRYQFGQEADLNYHELMTEQLDRLGNRLGNPTYEDYAARFAGYRYTPPTVSFPAAALPDVYPAPRDRFRDGLRVPFRMDKRGSVVTRVLGGDGRVVRSVSQSARTGSNAFMWDGLDTQRRPAPPGTYTVEIRATDIAGNRQTYQLGRTFEVKRDTTAPAVVSVVVRSAGSKATDVLLTATDAESPWISGRVTAGSHSGETRGSSGRTFRIRIPAPRASVARSGKLYIADSSANVVIVPLQ